MSEGSFDSEVVRQDRAGVAFNAGGMEKKFRVEGIGGQVFIERKANNKFITNWKAMIRAGFPVPSQLIVEPGTGYMLVSDMKGDGEIYGKGFYQCMTEPDRFSFDRRHPEIDDHFRRLTSPENLPDIEQRIDQLVQQANTLGFQLPSDDPFELIIKPDGSWSIAILDLQTAETNESRDTREFQNRQDSNTVAKLFFHERIQKIREYIH